MKILVASQNQIKAEAVREAFRRLLDEAVNVQLSNDEIDSGVSSQPLSLEETARGALNRLNAITAVPGYDYYVAIEGGIYAVELPVGKHWYESACAAVKSSASQNPCVAYGPAYPVPDQFIRHLEAGKDLNEAMEAETGIKEAGKGIGFNGWLTNGKLDRMSASAEAVLLAIAGLEHAND
jgi:inosine/xanthosine triphosphatase